MTNLIRRNICSSSVRSEMRALGVSGGRTPLLTGALVLLALVDVAAASIALAGS